MSRPYVVSLAVAAAAVAASLWLWFGPWLWAGIPRLVWALLPFLVALLAPRLGVLLGFLPPLVPVMIQGGATAMSVLNGIGMSFLAILAGLGIRRLFGGVFR